MSKQIAITNEKQILTGIKKAFDAMESSKKSYVYSVIELGEKLIEAKIKAGHGNWEKFCESSLKTALGGRISSPRQALKYMEVAENKLLVLEYFSDENSVNGLNKAITDASPEQLARAEELKRLEEEKAQQAEAEKQRRAQELEAKRAEEQIIAQVQTKEPEAIDAEFIEVKQEPKKPELKHEAVQPGMVQVKPEYIENLEDGLFEAHSLNQSIKEDNDSMLKVFESDDKLKAAIEEAQKFREMNRVLNERINGLMSEKNAAIQTAKSWQRKVEKLEKELKALKGVSHE